jgi:hypothetical protein
VDQDHDGFSASDEEGSNGFADIVQVRVEFLYFYPSHIILQHLEDARGKRKRAVLVIENPAANTFTVTGLPTGGSVDLSETCVETLIWPVQRYVMCDPKSYSV